MRIISLVIAVLLILLGVTFAVLNAGTVAFNYYIGSTAISLSLLLVITLGVGMLLGLMVSLKPLVRLKCENRHLKNQLKDMKEEVTELRHLPIKDRD